ncbi:MAG: ATP-dependent DNA helicase [Leptospiraceae bacterium]|nr:ATP-dependent DNA helicase [Leptospiraceae bacterium]MDW7975418.1 ATP-dependent DNA helicase [Leptospiraceae bacterium]
MDKVRPIFENANLWKQIFPNYQIRESQVRLAEAIYQAIQEESFLVAEAGTGTGKTLAYLIASILATQNEKILISTETKTLQNQILYKDLPIVEKVLQTKIHAEIAFGSMNYICKRRLQEFLNSEQVSKFSDKVEIEDFKEWEKQTQRGLIFEYPKELPKNFIDEVVRIPDLCLKNQCPNFNISYYFLEKKKWEKAKILIVNHHLLASHIISNFTLLPKFEIAIIDEAHSFPQIFREQSLQCLSSQELKSFFKKHQIPNVGLIDEFFNEIKKQIFSNHQNQELKIRIKNRIHHPSLLSLLNQLIDIKGELENKQNHILELFPESKTEERNKKELELEQSKAYLNQIENILNTLYEGPKYNYVHYFESDPSGLDGRICITPVEVGSDIKEKFLQVLNCVIFTSATLSVNQKFNYFNEKVGLDDYAKDQFRYNSILVPSPFVYKKQALVYIPKNLNPDSPQYVENITKEIFRHLELLQGNILVIFTSKKTLNDVYKKLTILDEYKNYLLSRNIKIFSQEILGAPMALKNYLENKNSVLFGLDTFRQGIDIAGDKLKGVILVKLPFLVPTDPIQEAQSEMEKEKERDYFLSVQIPEMIIKLKQGMGRLIRTETDKGIISILDSRIYQKQYGKFILNALSDYHIVNDFEELKKCYQENILVNL